MFISKNRKSFSIKTFALTLLLFIAGLSMLCKTTYASSGTGKAALTSFQINSSTLYINKTYTISANGTSPNGILYKFWLADLSTGKWTVLQDYSDKSSVSWTPNISGKYEIVVHAKDTLSSKEEDDYRYSFITVNGPSAKLNSMAIDNMQPYAGNTCTISANGTSPNGILYKFWLADLSTGKWTVLQDYSDKSSVSWTPNISGKYELVVHAKDKLSSKEEDDYKYSFITVNNPSAKLNNFSIDNSKVVTGGNYTLTANGTSSNSMLYKFWIEDYSTGKWSVLQDYSDKGSFTWQPQNEGNYRLVVHAKDKFSTAEEDDYRYFDITVKSNHAKLTSFNLSKNSSGSNIYTLSAQGDSPNSILYKFIIYDSSSDTWQTIRDYNSTSKMDWTIPHDGYYRLVVHVKDSQSASDCEDYKYIDVNFKAGEATLTGTAQLTGLSIDYNNQNVTQYFPGTEYNITATATSGVKPVYRFWVADVLLNKWTMIQDYDYNNKIQWSPPYSGRFEIVVHAKDITSNDDLQSYKYFYLNVSEVNANPNNYGVNEKVVNNSYNYSFYDAVNYQVANGGAVYDDNGNWDPATRDMIEYYLNPANFINGPYGKYQFLKLTYNDGISASDIDSILPGDTNNILHGKGSVFLQAGKTYNVNPIYLVAHTMLETGNGTSELANGVLVNGKKYYNMFGIHAFDNDPITTGSQYACQMGWDTPEKAIIGGAQWIYNNYLAGGQDTLYKMRWNPDNPGKHQYATDVRWAYNQIYNINKLASKIVNPYFVYEIPIYK